mgnify:CR=1 FL=1
MYTATGKLEDPIQRPFFNYYRKCIGPSYLFYLSLRTYIDSILRRLPTYVLYLLYIYEQLPIILAWDFILSALFFLRIIFNFIGSLMISLTFPFFWFFAFVFHAGTSKIGAKTPKITVHAPRPRTTQKLIFFSR